MELDVELPSGVNGRVRGLTGKEFRMLSDARRSRGGEVVTEILKACWVETVEHGPYKRFVWADAFMGDHVSGLIAVRRASFPPPDHEYEFDVPCQYCGARIRWQIDLGDLKQKKIPDATRAVLEKGQNEFVSEVGGVVFSFKLATARDAARAARLGRGNDRDRSMIASLATRILDVEGLEYGKDRIASHEAWLEGLEALEIRNVLGAMEDVDFGVETGFDVQCQSCTAEQEVDLPFGPAFFMPKRRASKVSSTADTSSGETR